MADVPNKWNDLSKGEQEEARRISQQAGLASASVSQVAKWLAAFRDYEGGHITAAELWERTDHAHGLPA